MTLTRVTFKHEGESGGMAFGPVTIVDVRRYDAWCSEHCTDALGIPYGSTPDGMDTSQGWITLAQAHAIAREHNTELEVV